MDKRDKYNRRVIKRYRAEKLIKNAARDLFIALGLISFTVAIAEPYRESKDMMIVRMCCCFLLGGVMCCIASKLHRKKIKPPTITQKRKLTDYSKDMTDLALKYEVISKPKK